MVYALNKCKYEWVLRVDADELLNKKLLHNISFLINNDNVAAYRIKRYNDCNKFSSYDYVTRLFRKSFVQFRGILHEYPDVSGKHNDKVLSEPEDNAGMPCIVHSGYASMERSQSRGP